VDLLDDRTRLSTAGDGPSDADEVLLDDVFEQALSAIEDDREIDPSGWLDGREDLRPRAEAVIDLARAVAVRHGARPDSRPMTVAGYEILREVGHSSMGSVFLAAQTALNGRRVALKVLPTASAMSPRARQRFLVESRALAKLSHPNIVAIHDVVDTPNLTAFSMEWVDGRTLAQLIDAIRAGEAGSELECVARELGCHQATLGDGNLALFLCEVGIRIARALSVVHLAGLLHRDVKPSNILIRRDGTPLLSDFGLARDEASSLHTRTGHYLGTPAYSAPEQLRGEHNAIDARSDVYSLGATLYEAFTLSVPHAGDSPAQILAHAEQRRAMPARKRNPRLSRDLETILGKALDPDPRRRYDSAAQFGDDLARLVALQPIHARPPGADERLRKWLRRNRAPVLTAAAAAVAVLGPGVYVGARWASRGARVEEARHFRLLAEQALLDPANANLIFGVAHPEAHLRAADNKPPIARGASEALAQYDRALALDLEDELTNDILLERDVVDAAVRLANAASPFTLSTAIVRRAPVTAAYVRAWSPPSARAFMDEPTEPISNPSHGSPETNRTAQQRAARAAASIDRRMLGLLTFLLGDAELSINAFEPSSPAVPSDGLADASLGLLYLEQDKNDSAYARLLSAANSFPEAGFLCVAVADAALRIGERDTAKRFLRRAEVLGLHDPFDTIIRIKADLAAADGDAVRARELYEWMIANHRGSTSFVHYVKWLRSRGELERAVGVAWTLTTIHSDVPQYGTAFVQTAEAWWAQLPEQPTWQRVRRLLDDPMLSFGSFFALLDAVERLDREPAGTGCPPSALESDWEFSDLLPRARAASSLSSRAITLRQLARQIEVRHMNIPQLIQLPSAVKTLLVGVWASSGSHLGVAIVDALGVMRHACHVMWSRYKHATLAVVALGGVAGAQITVSDTEFDPSLFDIVPYYAGLGGTYQFSQMQTGGDPGAFGDITFTIVAGNPHNYWDGSWVAIAGIYTGMTINPSIVGGVDHLDVSSASSWQGGTAGATYQTDGIVVRQAGQIYSHPLGLTSTGTWTTSSHAGLQESDFNLIVNLPTQFADPTMHPNFSGSGLPLQVGVYRTNSNGPPFYAGYTNSSGIDNWTVALFPRFTAYCAGDGSHGACPCNNDGTTGNGCGNSANVAGALLSASGNPALTNDTVLLQASGEPGPKLSIVLQGNATLTSPATFGAGLRCVGGQLKRLYVKHANPAGTVVVPDASTGDMSISARSAALGDPIAFGATRYYQTYYRDSNVPGGCSPESTFNITNGIQIIWSSPQ
jgi:serine/threonine protein kinase/tetratricopeptide (TPR) repeat protein